ncbi:hypothetical protein LOK49_Contig85G00003 [Camellia lanceoleosa]|nr:hypothetical protein LOK49_Contig85G00003 [Camellia lanceoleosa]
MASIKDRNNFVYTVKLAKQAERFDEMVGSMKTIVKLNVELTVEGGNLLSVGYKNLISARRASCLILSSVELSSPLPLWKGIYGCQLLTLLECSSSFFLNREYSLRVYDLF